MSKEAKGFTPHINTAESDFSKSGKTAQFEVEERNSNQHSYVPRSKRVGRELHRASPYSLYFPTSCTQHPSYI